MKGGPRKPRNLDRYSPAAEAIRGLEALAADLRKNAREGDLIRWDINLSFWNPDWERQPRPKPAEAQVETDRHGLNDQSRA
jgi:hypothetical protein